MNKEINKVTIGYNEWNEYEIDFGRLRSYLKKKGWGKVLSNENDKGNRIYRHQDYFPDIETDIREDVPEKKIEEEYRIIAKNAIDTLATIYNKTVKEIVDEIDKTEEFPTLIKRFLNDDWQSYFMKNFSEDSSGKSECTSFSIVTNFFDLTVNETGEFDELQFWRGIFDRDDYNSIDIRLVTHLMILKDRIVRHVDYMDISKDIIKKLKMKALERFKKLDEQERLSNEKKKREELNKQEAESKDGNVDKE